MLAKILKSVAHFIIAFFLIFIACLFILIIGFPIYFVRYLVSKLAPIFRPDLGKMLTTNSTIPGVDDIYGQPKQSIVGFIIAKGNSSLTSFQEILQHNTELVAKDPITGQLLFPEIQQCITTWCGFLFWKWDTKFDVRNHIRYYFKKDVDNPNPDQITEEMLQDIGSSIIYSPFIQGQSPWEIFFFPNVKVTKAIEADDAEGKERYSAFIVRTHHSLGDGFSLAKVLNFKINGNTTIDLQKPNFNPLPTKINIYKRIGMIFKAPFDLISESINAADPLSEWHVPEEKLQRKHNSGFSSPIPMSYIKEIKNTYRVGFGSVLISAFAGALQRFMIEAGHAKVPESIHCLHPLPMPTHPDKLRNNLTSCFASLPARISDPKERLLNTDRGITHTKENTLHPIAAYYWIKLIGGLWTFIIKRIAKNKLGTVFMSNFPLFKNEVNFMGLTGKSVYFVAGFTPGNVGIGFTSMSYGGFIRVSIGIDEGIVSSDTLSAKKCIQYFMEELDYLKKNAV